MANKKPAKKTRSELAEPVDILFEKSVSYIENARNNLQKTIETTG